MYVVMQTEPLDRAVNRPRRAHGRHHPLLSTTALAASPASVSCATGSLLSRTHTMMRTSSLAPWACEFHNELLLTACIVTHVEMQAYEMDEKATASGLKRTMRTQTCVMSAAAGGWVPAASAASAGC